MATAIKTQTAANHPNFTNGARLFNPNDGKVYLLIDGLLRMVPDGATYNNLFGNFTNNTAGFGPPLTKGAYLANPTGQPGRYLIVDGTKRWVISEKVWDEFGFNLNMERSQNLSGVPDGPNIS